MSSILLNVPDWLVDIAIEVHRLASDEATRQRFVEHTGVWCGEACGKIREEKVNLFCCESRPWRLCFCYGLLAMIHDALQPEWERKVIGDAWLFLPDDKLDGPDDEHQWHMQTALYLGIDQIRDSHRPDVDEMLALVRQDLEAINATNEGTGGNDALPDDAIAKLEAETPVLDRLAIMDGLQAAPRKAYLAYEFAESKAGKRLEDREAYTLLQEDGIPEDAGDLGELSDYELPMLDTWSRQLREARNALGEQKYTKRAGRPYGGSLVPADRL